MKQTQRYVCTLEEFILHDLHYLEYKVGTEILYGKYTGFYTITTIP